MAGCGDPAVADLVLGAGGGKQGAAVPFVLTRAILVKQTWKLSASGR